MTIILARAACRVWLAIPDWERRWRPYALGRRLPFAWLPVPSSLALENLDGGQNVRERYGLGAGPIVGHLGSYSVATIAMLSVSLPEILERSTDTEALLLGEKSEDFRRQFVYDRPQLANRVHATGPLAPQDLVQSVCACDVLVQPYPDGISSRRTSAMAGLALGVPVVTTIGRLTEQLWQETGGVSLVRVDEPHRIGEEVLRLLGDDDARRTLADRGREIYARHFDLRHTIDALRHANPHPCVSQS
jgi:glycosyltransferase involved in cell wall biosynthesis